MDLSADYTDRDFAAFAAGWFAVEEAAAVGVAGFADIVRTTVVEDAAVLAAA